jgi:cobalamin synthase
MSQPPADPDARSVRAPFPGLAGLAHAVRFVRSGSGMVGAWAVYLPAVGAALGVLWVTTDRVAAALAGRTLSSLAVVGVAVAATRGQPLLALGRLLAALASRRPRHLAVLESGSGALVYGCTAAVVVAEVGVLSALDRFRVVGLAFAPVLGCCSMVVLAVGSRAARADGRRLKFAPEVTFREFGLATAATFAGLFLAAEFLGLLLILATAASTIAARVFFHRCIDGVNETAVLATAEAVQLLILALLVAL